MERALDRESGGPGSSTSSSANCPGKWKRNFVSSFQSLGLSALIFEKGKVDAVPSSSGRFKVAPPPLFSLPCLIGRQEVGTEMNQKDRDPSGIGFSPRASYASPPGTLDTHCQQRPCPFAGAQEGLAGQKNSTHSQGEML